jgi:hypothetical protein
MKSRAFSVFGLMVLLFVLVFCSQPAVAETTHCTQITSVPYTISNPGVYCLVNNVSTTANAIFINASNVVVDLNGYSISQTGGAGNTQSGIYATSQKNVTVRNGTVGGFYVGIELADSGSFTNSSGYVVEDMLVKGSPFIGIEALGLGSVVRNNEVLKTGGSTFGGSNSTAFGIYVAGLGAEVNNNLVVNTHGTGTGVGTAIVLNGDQNLAIHNHVVDANTGVGSNNTTAQCRDNITSGMTISRYSNCIDLGNNQ